MTYSPTIPNILEDCLVSNHVCLYELHPPIHFVSLAVVQVVAGYQGHPSPQRHLPAPPGGSQGVPRMK